MVPSGKLANLASKKIQVIYDTLLSMYGEPEYETPDADELDVRATYEPGFVEEA